MPACLVAAGFTMPLQQSVLVSAFFYNAPKVVDGWLALLLRIQGVLGSNLGLEAAILTENY
jgi:hypothetical protein